LATLFFANSIHLKDFGSRNIEENTRKCLEASVKLFTNALKLVLV